MLSFTRKIDYAMVAMTHLAMEQNQMAQPDDSESDKQHATISAKQIAELYGLPLPLLTNILKDMKHTALLNSTRGARGGYYLARDADQITLVDVIESAEGPISMTPCCTPELTPKSAQCQLWGHCPLSPMFRKLHQKMVDFLRSLTVADLARFVAEGDQDPSVDTLGEVLADRLDNTPIDK